MSGGLIQIVAYGVQDVFLTGNPQITFFKTAYRRHTNFAVETIEYPFNGRTEFGNKVSIKFDRNGDLISKMYLKVTLNCVNPGGSKFAWVRRVGHALINRVNISIGGAIIDRQLGTWLDIWYELARTGDLERGYDIMVGDVPEMTDYNDCVKPEFTLFIPLKFWFNRHTGLAIPMIALQYHKVVLNLEFAEAKDLVIRDCNFDMCKLKIKEASLLTNFIYLDSDERRRFAQVGHEYLIEQLQFNGTEQVEFDVNKYNLDYNFPTKEIIWAMNNGNYVSNKSFVYYSNNNPGEWCLEDAACTIVYKSVSVGEDPTDQVGGCWYEVLPGDCAYIGTFNVNNKSDLSVFINPESLKVDDYGITDKINANIIITANRCVICDDVTTELTIRDISIPVCRMIDTRSEVCDPIVNLFGNYGVLIDGTINPVKFGLIQMNGHDRFDRREGTYFNNVQPDQHHENTPRDGINVYSFALYPEQHQPSGTSNLSRIDSTNLTVWIEDQSKINYNEPDINLINDLNRLFIFGVNYNVLRIVSGLAGLAYVTG